MGLSIAGGSAAAGDRGDDGVEEDSGGAVERAQERGWTDQVFLWQPCRKKSQDEDGSERGEGKARRERD